MGVGALAFAALDAFGQNGAAEIVQDDQLKVGPWPNLQLYLRVIFTCLLDKTCP